MFAEDKVGNRLAAFLAVSLGVHLMALGAFKSAHRPIRIESPPVSLQWIELAPVAATKPRPTGSHRMTPSPPRDRVAAPSEPVARTPEQVEGPPVAAFVSAPTQNPPRLPVADLLASARAIAREMAAPEARPPVDGGPSADRPILPQLDRALRREAAGERWLGNGLVRIVSASGRIYCLQAPPDFARDGPVAMVSVPTTCP